MTDRADTHRRLVEMRERLLDGLGERIDGGALAMLSGINGALAAIDAVPDQAGIAAQRVVVTDEPTIAVVLYAAADRVATLEIDPLRALGIAGELVKAAHRHLSGRAASPNPRGGDPHARARAQRDRAIRNFASLLGSDLSLEQKAETIISKAGRYKPAPSDVNGNAERRALHQIAAAGVPVPQSRRHLARILKI